MYMGMEKQITSRNTIIYTSILTKKHAIKKNYLLRNTPSINDALVEFCRVNTGVKLVWILGVRFDTGV